MLSKRNGGAMAAIVLTVLLSAVTPASAAPWEWEPAPPAEAEESLVAQVWQWLAGLFDSATAGTVGTEEETSSGTCSAPTVGGRGCAIDPNGMY